MRRAVVTVASEITVPAGLFAPGHLGELTRVIPHDLVDAVLEETCCTERRLRMLPARAGVYLALALALFPDASLPQAWRKLTAGLRARGVETEEPSETALRELLDRVGPRPLRLLFEVLAGPLGLPGMPGITWRGYRLVSVDGIRSLRVPDSDANRAWLGKQNAKNGVTGYPVLSAMIPAETGTRSFLGPLAGTAAGGEARQAAALAHLLDATMLLLADRGFDSGAFFAAVHGAKARFLVRLSSSRRPRPVKRLPDGTYLAVIGGVTVRIITARVTVTCADGTSYEGRYRLATTLLDHRAYPADELVSLYHQRWEHEVAYLGLRHALLKGRVLRSRDRAGVEQETGGYTPRLLSNRYLPLAINDLVL